MDTDTNRTPLSQAFADIIEGVNVKRSRHDLTWEFRPVVNEFIEALTTFGYQRTTVRDVDVAAGQRAPAFVIVGTVAYFGWVFWEKFTQRTMRKLFGSVVRNAKGDWAVQIPAGNATPLYVDAGGITDMDVDAPSSL